MTAGMRREGHGLGLHTATLGLLAFVVAVLTSLLSVQAASAHAQLLDTDPAEGAVLDEAPAHATLRFNEAVQLLPTSIELFSASGSPIALTARVSGTDVFITMPTELTDGRYALSYRVVSADGHPVSGAVSFSIGDADGPGAVPLIATETPDTTTLTVNVLTALQYIGVLIFGGLVFFQCVILRTSDRAPPRIRTVRWLFGVVAAVASAALIPVLALNVTGSDLTHIRHIDAWRAGVLWPPVISAVAIALGVVVSGWAGRRPTESQPHSTSRLVVQVSLATIAVCAPVLVGHTQLIEPRVAMIGADVGHLIAGSFWLGGIIGLGFVIAAARRSADADPSHHVRIVQTFSRYALWSVVVLTASGLTMAIMILDTISALWTTTYGLLLIAKLVTLTPIIVMAAYNRFRLLPLVEKQDTPQSGVRALRRALRVEAGLLIIVLAITGFLTNQSPDGTAGHGSVNSVQADPDVKIQAQLQGLLVSGSLTPGEAGENTFTFTLRYENAPVAPEDVIVRTILPSRDLGPFEVTPILDPRTGEYTATLSLPFADEWRVQVMARIDAFTQPIVTLPVTIR